MTPTTSSHLAKSIQQDRVAQAARDRFAASVAPVAETPRHPAPAWHLVAAVTGLRRIAAF